MNFIKSFILILSVITIFSCDKESITPEMEEEMEEECNLTDVTYNGTIKSILSGCQGSSCHGSGTGREMTNFTEAKAYAQNGRILGALNRDNNFSPMPKNGSKLSQCKIDQVSAWIDADYPEG
ncbi:hypothetical protein [Portibacter lacus]|uniref:Cytochrome c domain-containing protein n=1 Tax=Portibacter lacus TaxID=1099794 RepID=A0AA37SLL4_9BACT|nr:hypothetical protein [Portibacter lacus]GLR15532.1 hypothetical protein GCM10007940_01470 [Portibacter lacus]